MVESLAAFEASVPPYNVFTFSGSDADMSGLLAQPGTSLANNVAIAASLGRMPGTVDDGSPTSKVVSNVLFTGMQLNALQEYARKRKLGDDDVERTAEQEKKDEALAAKGKEPHEKGKHFTGLDELIAQTELEARLKARGEREANADMEKARTDKQGTGLNDVAIGGGIAVAAAELAQPAFTSKFAGIDLSGLNNTRGMVISGGSDASAVLGNTSPTVLPVVAQQQGMALAA